MKRIALVTLAMVLSVVVVAPASAGGATWLLNGEDSNFAAFAPGQHVEATSLIWLPSVREEGSNGDFHGGPQHGPYFGWVVPRPDPDAQWPPPLPDDAIQVGEVVFHETDDPKMMRLSLSFEMPDLAPGDYGLVTCNEGCERQIADIWMTGFIVAEDAGQAMLASRIARLDSRLFATRMRLNEKTEDLKRLRSRFDSEVVALQEQVDDLRARPLATREPSRAPVGTWPFVAASIFVALAAVALFGTRGRTTSLEH